MRDMATISQGNQEPLVVEVGREDPRWLGVSKSVECDTFSSQCSHLTLLVVRQEGHPTCKTLDVGLLAVMI